MTYAPIVIYDGKIRTEMAVTNEWILANKPNYIELSSDQQQIVADDDGTDIATITVQLKTPLLIDGNRNNVSWNGDIELYVDGGINIVSLIDGVGTIEIGAVYVGTYIIRGKTYDSNILEIEAI